MGKPTKHYGMWRIRYTDENGERRSKTFKDRKSAELALKQAETIVEERKRGLRPVEMVPKTWLDASEYWAENRAPQKRSYKDSTTRRPAPRDAVVAFKADQHGCHIRNPCPKAPTCEVAWTPDDVADSLTVAKHRARDGGVSAPRSVSVRCRGELFDTADFEVGEPLIVELDGPNHAATVRSVIAASQRQPEETTCETFDPVNAAMVGVFSEDSTSRACGPDPVGRTAVQTAVPSATPAAFRAQPGSRRSVRLDLGLRGADACGSALVVDSNPTSVGRLPQQPDLLDGLCLASYRAHACVDRCGWDTPRLRRRRSRRVD